MSSSKWPMSEAANSKVADPTDILDEFGWRRMQKRMGAAEYLCCKAGSILASGSRGFDSVYGLDRRSPQRRAVCVAVDTGA